MEEVYVQRVESLVNYIELHLTSLQQDLDKLSEQMEKYDEDSKAHRSMDEEYLYLSGQITAASHLLSVVNDTMVTWKREKNNG